LISDADIHGIIENTSLYKVIKELPILIISGTGFIGSQLVTAFDKLIDNRDIDN